MERFTRSLEKIEERTKVEERKAEIDRVDVLASALRECESFAEGGMTLTGVICPANYCDKMQLLSFEGISMDYVGAGIYDLVIDSSPLTIRLLPDCITDIKIADNMVSFVINRYSQDDKGIQVLVFLGNEEEEV